MTESDVSTRMQPLKDQLANTMRHLHTVFEIHVFIAICRGYWDRMGQVTPPYPGFYHLILIELPGHGWANKLSIVIFLISTGNFEILGE